jgi:uncharacterized membrane protein YeaQ/YmgE (transglycosylase-associated protein family)
MIYSLLVGLIAGWLAGRVMKGSGYGCLTDIILGLVGGVIGRAIFGASGSLPGSILVSFIGAVILVWLVHQLKRA